MNTLQKMTVGLAVAAGMVGSSALAYYPQQSYVTMPYQFQATSYQTPYQYQPSYYPMYQPQTSVVNQLVQENLNLTNSFRYYPPPVRPYFYGGYPFGYGYGYGYNWAW